jgi:hypothetical protein
MATEGGLISLAETAEVYFPFKKSDKKNILCVLCELERKQARGKISLTYTQSKARAARSEIVYSVSVMKASPVLPINMPAR